MTKSKNKQLPKRKLSSGSAVNAFLRQVGVTPMLGNGGGRGRLIFSMDATASREPTWDQACQLQGEMFDVANKTGGINVQLAYYRGFREFYSSGWLHESRALVSEMTSVVCRGGRTQIGKIFQHALVEARADPVAAMVFVGDSMEENPDELCELAGELGLLGVRTFMFLEGADAAAVTTFREIARLTGGACVPFDSASADQLRVLLGAVAAYAAGGKPALERYERDKSEVLLRLTHQLK